MKSVPPLTITRHVNLVIATSLCGWARIAYLHALDGLKEAARREGHGLSCALTEAGTGSARFAGSLADLADIGAAQSD
jgi:hypothetical protein